MTPVWTPSPAISGEVGYGERYSRKDRYLSLSRRFKQAILRAEYERMLSDSRTKVLDEDVVQFEDVFGNPVRNLAFNHDVEVAPQAPACDPLFLHDPSIRHPPTGLR